jgi:hypothetical protein
VKFHNNLTFYYEELLAPLPTPKLEDHHLSAVSDCLFNIYAATRSSAHRIVTVHWKKISDSIVTYHTTYVNHDSRLYGNPKLRNNNCKSHVIPVCDLLMTDDCVSTRYYTGNKGDDNLKQDKTSPLTP